MWRRRRPQLPRGGEWSRNCWRIAIDGIVVKRLGELGTPRTTERSQSRAEVVREPPLLRKSEGTWTQKMGKRRRRRADRASERSEGVGTDVTILPSTPMSSGAKERAVSRRRESVPGTRTTVKTPGARTAGRKWPVQPKTAAVTLTIPPEVAMTYAEVMVAAKEKISLEDIGISHLEVRKARTGRLILGVPGEGAKEKADRFAECLREATAECGVRVARPCRRLDLRVRGLEESTTREEAAAAIAEC